MGWSIIREATDEDRERLAARAEAFCARHHLAYEADLGEMPADAIALATIPGYGARPIDEHRARYLRRLWLRIVGRALGNARAEGIAYGYVGFHID